MADAWRCFVAVPIGPALQSQLAGAVEALRNERPELEESWRWSEPEAWHITLAFLGATPSGDVPGLADRVAEAVAEHEPFRLAGGGLGAFPSRRAGRVLWYGIHDPERRLRDLANAVRIALGLETGSPFHPHLTLGRARHRHGAPVGGLLDTVRLPDGELLVDRALLYRSHAGSGPARYEVLAEAALSEAVARRPDS